VILPGEVYVSIYRDGATVYMEVTHAPSGSKVKGETTGNEGDLKATLLEQLEAKVKA
jgi:hypothetical protein